jgi:alkanesulfonate monooxygenase SsuD/methylene tetrahydromethanopterin reductase-like flavin-dependent oxidoreductase (luciferase family)
MSKLQVGVALPTIEEEGGAELPDIGDASRRVEQLGFESVWVPDVMSGEGTSSQEATVTLAAAAAVTERVRVGFSVLVLPMRPIAWTAAQIATLQHVSGNRVLLGVGAGGFPGTSFWDAVGAGAPGARGRRLDDALDVLPSLLAGKPTELDHGNGRSVVTLAPAVPVPPILVGGLRDSEASIRRAATYGDGWFPSLLTPEALAAGVARLEEAAAEQRRAITSVTVGIHAVLGEDAAARSAHAALVQNIHEAHGIPLEEATEIPITGSPGQAAERLAAYAEAGADRLVMAPPDTDWTRQAELVAEAYEQV